MMQPEIKIRQSEVTDDFGTETLLTIDIFDGCTTQTLDLVDDEAVMLALRILEHVRFSDQILSSAQSLSF